MKIEIDRKSTVIIVVIAVVAFLIGMGVNNSRDDGWHMGWMGNHHNSSSQFSANDIMFAQMMIPHHQQAIEMSDLALSISKNQDILALAAQIKAAQAPEIKQMKSWLTAAGTSLMGAHGMAMEGMLSDSEIADLKNSTGSTFDRLFLEGMIGHHQGAITMVRMIENSKNDEARLLAKNIKESQSKEIELMRGYLLLIQ